MAETKGRKKVNFMVDKEIIVTLHETFPAGKRSDFINTAIKDALIQHGRRKANEAMENIAKSAKLKISTDEIIKLKNYGRL